jgi:S-adenosylmethionine synthetase
MNLRISLLNGPAATALEIVERKGLGHPDTICDALAEQASIALSRCYLERFGAVLHHNVDKALLWGGSAIPRFGGGEVTAPIEIYLAGRATREYRGVGVPVEEIVTERARQWLGEHVRHLDPQRHVRVHTLIRPSSPDLVNLFVRAQEQGIALSNDTSIGAGFAPLSVLERVVLTTELHLNAPGIKARYPAIGEDIKVMGVREADRIALTVACALVDRHITGPDDYRAKKARVQELALEEARGQAGSAWSVDVVVNAADGDTPESLYLTVTGTSAEAGDDGQVGRGNRVNGLITPYRPMSLEAAAGKNPITHTGKLYNIAARRLAHALVEELPEIEEAHCWLVSSIGHPVHEPQVLDVRVRLRPGATLPERRLAEIAHAQLDALAGLWREATADKLPVF